MIAIARKIGDLNDRIRKCGADHVLNLAGGHWHGGLLRFEHLAAGFDRLVGKRLTHVLVAGFNASGDEITQKLADHVFIASFFKVCLHDRLGISIGFFCRQAHLGGRPLADQLVATRSDAERHFLIVRKLVFERVFAIMGTRQRPGSGLTDHTFRSLAASEHDARECVCEAAFTGLLNAFAARLKERQREWRQLHADRPSQLGDARPGAGSNPPSSGPAPQQQEIFARHLDPAGDELTAEDALAALIEWLHVPEAHLRISARDGQAAAAPGADAGLSLPLMSSTDRRHWLVCLAEFPLQEALGAIGQTPAATRYILI